MITARLREVYIADMAACLRRYIRGESHSGDIDRLVASAALIVRQRVGGRLHAAARAEGVSIPQMASSIIGRLFGQGEAESALIAALRDDLEAGDEALFLRFQAVVARFAAQELFHLWNQNDPPSARLWRGLRRAVKHDPRIASFPAGKPEWAATADESNPPIDFIPLAYPEVKELVANVYDSKASIADLIVAALAEAASRRDLRPAARIEDFFAALREIITDVANVELAARVSTMPVDPFLQAAIKQVTEQVLSDICAGLKKYERSGKLQPEITGYFNSALADIVADCADGGPAQSYYQYLSAHWPDLTLDEYRRNFRAKFEYLAETTRDGFFEGIRCHFGEKNRQGGNSATM